MGLIYCTTNLIDNKKYIGKQWDENKNYYLGSGLHLLRAIKKYGKENFKKEILEKGIFDRKILSEKEKYYIAFYEALLSNNYYNLTSGGDGGKEGIILSEETKEKMRLAAIGRKHKSLLKPIYQYDLNGFFIQEFEGVSPACKILGWPQSRTTDIVRACRKARGVQSAYGYVWKYKESIKELDFCI